jgi:signal transduction histidine kinase
MNLAVSHQHHPCGRDGCHKAVVLLGARRVGVVGGACIRIADDGPGIPARLSERLFEPFVSGSGSDGSGLGLTISRELAASHGGDLRLVQTGPAGTTFELRLPL